MKCYAVIIFMMVCVMSTSTMAAPSPQEVARRDFEKQYVEFFTGKTARPPSKSDSSSGRLLIALPVDDDSRLQFIEATFLNGHFEHGTLHRFGLPDVLLSRSDFVELRRDYPMAAAGEFFKNDVVLLSPSSHKLSWKVPETMRRRFWIDPIADLYGTFLTSIGRLGVKTDDVAYRVVFIDKSGKKSELACIENKRGLSSLGSDKLLARLGEISGLVSDRERVEYFMSGTVQYDW